MMKISISKFAIAAAILIVAGSILYSVRHQKPGTRPGPGSKEQESTDLKVLEKVDANWAEQSQALMRLSIQQKPEALSFIKAKLSAKDEQLSPWATRALGYFTEPEAFALIREQLRSENPSIREAAIDALSMRPHPEKAQMLNEARSLVKGDTEKARLQMATLRMTTDPEAKSTLARSVISTLQRKDLEGSARNILISQIFFQSPRTREVESYFQSLASNMKQTDELSAVAVVRALKIYCPANRYSIFKDVLGRSTLSIPGKSQVLNELIFHTGPEANSLYQAASSEKGLHPTFMENLRKKLEDPRMKSPCSSQQAGTSNEKSKQG